MSSLFRFSIRELLIAVTVVAVGITALFNTNEWWEWTLWGFALVLAALAILFVVYWRGESQAVWLGFLVFAAFYFAVLIGMQLAGVDSRHPGTKLALEAYSRLLPMSRQAMFLQPDISEQDIGNGQFGGMGSSGAMPKGGGGGMGPSSGFLPPAVSNMDYVNPDDFVRIAHALLLLVTGAVGAKVAQAVYRARQPTPYMTVTP